MNQRLPSPPLTKCASLRNVRIPARKKVITIVCAKSTTSDAYEPWQCKKGLSARACHSESGRRWLNVHL